MKVLGISGSARKGGNMAWVLKRIRKGETK